MGGRLRHTDVVARDWRDDRIAELEALVTKLMAKVETLTARVADLEEKLAAASRNSSDPRPVRGRPRPPPGRKPGGQPGHKRHTREMFPPDKVRSVTECKPQRCADCNHRLRGEDPEPYRHQVRS